MSDTSTAVATTNGAGHRDQADQARRDQADQDRRDRRALADRVRLKAKLLSLSDIDRRTNAFKRTQSIIDQLEADVGGDPTTGQKLLIQRAAVVSAMCESEEAKWLSGGIVDPAVFCTLSNALRRLLESVGVHERVARDISPSLEQISRHLADQEGREVTVTDQAEDNQEVTVDAVNETDTEAAA